MVTLIFALLQPRADLGDNIVATPLGNEDGFLEDGFALVHISSSDMMVDGEQMIRYKKMAEIIHLVTPFAKESSNQSFMVTPL